MARGAGATEALDAEFLDELAAFVRKGKGVIVTAGPNVSAEVYNRLLGARQLLPLKLGPPRVLPALQPTQMAPA